MGAGASRLHSDGHLEQAPINKGDSMQFAVAIATANTVCTQDAQDAHRLRQKSPHLQLEISKQGFRLLRPKTDEALMAFAWGHIHSWTHAPGNFVFRYFDERTKSIQQLSFLVRHVNTLVNYMERHVTSILQQRQSNCISNSDFLQACNTIEQAPVEEQLAQLRTLVKNHNVTSQQATQLLECLQNSFDQVEAAVYLHDKLVDQNNFRNVLEALESSDDRTNVWHRITIGKRRASVTSRSASLTMRSSFASCSSPYPSLPGRQSLDVRAHSTQEQ